MQYNSILTIVCGLSQKYISLFNCLNTIFRYNQHALLWKCSHVFTQMKDTQSHRSAINRFVIECAKEIMLLQLFSGRCLYSILFRFNQTFNGEAEIAGKSDRLVWSINPTNGFLIESEKPVCNAVFFTFPASGFLQLCSSDLRDVFIFLSQLYWFYEVSGLKQDLKHEFVGHT